MYTITRSIYVTKTWQTSTSGLSTTNDKGITKKTKTKITKNWCYNKLLVVRNGQAKC